MKKQYEIRGYPTVLYTDPAGKQIRESGTREAGALVGEITGISRKFPGKLTFWSNSLKAAAVTAKASKKKVALYVAREDADPAKTHAALNKSLGDRRLKLIWTWETGTEKKLEEHGLEAAPAVVVFDVVGEKHDLTLTGKITLKEGEDLKALNDALDEILKNSKK